MFGRLLLKSLVKRRARLAVAAFAIVLGASLVSALANLSLDVGGKVGRELRAYGANITVTPREQTSSPGASLGPRAGNEGALLSERDLSALDGPELAPSVVAYAPFLYGVVEVDGHQVVLAGTRFDGLRKVSPWLSVTGRWIEDSGADGGALVGAHVARQLGLAPGSELEIAHRRRGMALRVAGIVDAGGSEDDQILVSLELAQEILQRPGAVGAVLVSAMTDRQELAATAGAIERNVPAAQAKILGQIADAEKAVYAKIQMLVGLVAALVLVAGALSVMSTMTTTVLERTPEIGLMRALGADSRRIAGLFLSECLVMAAIGGALGFGLGWVMSQIIGRTVFSAGIAFHWLAIPITLGVAIGVALLAGMVPVRRALSIDPAVVLRAE